MRDAEFLWPEPGRRFFYFEKSRPDADTWMGRSLGDYAYMYQQSAEDLIDLACEAPGVVNPHAMPAVFLFRHYVELSLKAMIIDASLLNDERGSFPDGHQLRKLWSDLRNLMDRADLDETDEQRATTDVVEAMINELDTADPRSMSFRYPVGTKESGRKALLNDEFEYFDMQKFRDQARRLANWIAGSIDYIDAALQSKRDLESDYGP